MTFSLNTTIIKTEENTINNAIVLLHGYGGDGKDISMLSLNWKRFLPNTIFLCPDGHEKCAINTNGFKWLDLTKEDKKYIIEASKKDESIIYQFIKEVKNKYGEEKSKHSITEFIQT